MQLLHKDGALTIRLVFCLSVSWGLRQGDSTKGIALKNFRKTDGHTLFQGELQWYCV
jgi:hypothetical protein